MKPINQKAFESKYYNIGSPPSGWTKGEFIFALSILEHLSLEKLKELTEGLGVKFSPSFHMETEDYIHVLWHETTKEKLLEALKQIEKEYQERTSA